MKTVGYRSRSLPAHTNRSHLRKSHSLRNTPNSATFKPTGSQQVLNSNVGNINSNGNGNNSANNQYAQPLKTNRSHSTAGIRERKKKTVVTTSSSVTNLSSITSGTNGTSTPPSSAPPIPEPDYSLSESENDDEGEDETDEDGESEIAKELEKAAAREKLEATRETSGNSNTSGSSSSGSGSLPHSFSVEEIQKVRTQLKSSKSHPNDFLLQQTQQLAEDGDNSSSGVSSDQDVPVGPPMGFDDTAVRNLANQESNQHPTTGALLTGVNPIEKESNQTKRSGYGSGLLTRHAVSLAQLPPPIEADAEEQNNDLFVPPPPEFNAGPSAGNQDQEVMVFAPPPQFCDNKQQQQQQPQNAAQNRVKIIGAIPKVAGNQVKATGGRLP